jgi:cell division transport system permease protein
MGQAAKASIKRKPSYFMSILGVTLVLFLLGIIGWFMLNGKKLGNYFKENVEVRVYLRGDLNVKDSTALMQYISAQPYVKTIEYVNKEEGKKRYMAEGNEDWGRVLEANPLPNAIYFKVKKDWLNNDTLKSIKASLEQTQQSFITDVQYPEALIGNMSKNIRQIELVFLVIAILLALVVIVLIDNTIRLAMFSNRFLIKTMQMVGATRWFIAKPMDVRAVINGAISGIIAAAAIGAIVIISENVLPEMKAIHDTGTLFILFFVLIIIGMGITLFSTHRSVLKYLKMKLDDLY